jgi:hypothetical protein
MRRVILPFVVVAIIAACGDPPTKESPLPKAAAKPALSAVQAPSPTKKPSASVRSRSARPSTVCTRYRRQLTAADRAAGANPTAAAKAKVTSLQTLVTDACQ